MLNDQVNVMVMEVTRDSDPFYESGRHGWYTNTQEIQGHLPA